MTLFSTPKTARTSTTPRKFAAFSAFVLCGALAASTAFFGGCASTGASAAARNARGVNLYAAGDYDGAIAVFQEAIETNPSSAEAFYNLGAAYQRKGNATGNINLLIQAENAYWAALERDAAPETIVCCYRGIATSATTRGDADGALQTLQDWSDRNPDSIEPKLEIAYFLEAQDRDDDAYAILQDVAEKAPNDYRAFYKMGVLQERAGNVEEALNQTTIAGKLKPTDQTVAKRTAELRAQLASARRGGSLETADAVPGETKLVSSTSAQAVETLDAESLDFSANSDENEMKTPTVPEAPELPASLDSSGAANESATQTLDADEIVLFAAPQISGATANANVGKGGDSDSSSSGSARWIASNGEKAAELNADAGTLPDGTGGSGGDVVFVAQNAEQTASSKGTQAAPLASASATAPPTKSPPRPRRKRADVGSGPPSTRAGAIF